MKWLWLIYHKPDSILSLFLWENYRLPTIGSELQQGFQAMLPCFFLRDIFLLYPILSISATPSTVGFGAWRWMSSDFFTCKSVYNLLINLGVHFTYVKFLWKSRAPLKVKNFTWILLQDKLFTRYNLKKRGWADNVTCVICMTVIERNSSTFLTCPFARKIWAYCFLIRRPKFHQDDVKGF